MASDKPHMLLSVVRGVAVVVHGAQAPSAAEWSEWLTFYRANAPTVRGLLVYSLGGGPDGKQRSALAAVFSELPRLPPTYIVTSSVVMRGIVTAICWFLPPSRRVQTFALHELDQALRELALAPAECREVKATIQAHLAVLSPTAAAMSL